MDAREISPEELEAEKAWKRIRRRVTWERRLKVAAGLAFGGIPPLAGAVLVVLY